MKTQKKKGIIISSIIVILVTISAIFFILAHNQFNQKKDAIVNMNQLIANNENQKKTNKFYYEYYYNPDCKACAEIESNKEIKDLMKKNKDQMVYINLPKFLSNDHNYTKILSDWTTESQIMQTPTFVVKYKGYPLYTYSGKNIKTIEKLLNGENPINNVKFNKEIPTTQTYQNEFTDIFTNIESIPLIDTERS